LSLETNSDTETSELIPPKKGLKKKMKFIWEFEAEGGGEKSIPLVFRTFHTFGPNTLWIIGDSRLSILVSLSLRFSSIPRLSST
jgi:hypothetical protein